MKDYSKSIELNSIFNITNNLSIPIQVIENSNRLEFHLNSGQKMSLPIYVNDPRIGVRLDSTCNYGDIVSIRKAVEPDSNVNIPVKSSILELGEEKKCFYVNISNTPV